MRADDLVTIQRGFGMTIRAQFGLWDDNPRLLRDCKSRHPEDCSAEIVGRLQARLRAELPAEERARLEKLEAGMERVKLPDREFDNWSLSSLVHFLQLEVDRQLPAADRFQIECDPRDCGESVFVERSGSSLYEFYTNMFTGLDVRKAPPNLWIGPYYQPLYGIPENGILQRAYYTANGLGEETRQLVRTPAEWKAIWKQLSAAPGAPTLAPVIDFQNYSALVIALGERPTSGFEVSVVAGGLHRRTAALGIHESRPGKSCIVAMAASHPTGVFLLPRIAESVTYLENISDRECAQ